MQYPFSKYVRDLQEYYIHLHIHYIYLHLQFQYLYFGFRLQRSYPKSFAAQFFWTDFLTESFRKFHATYANQVFCATFAF